MFSNFHLTATREMTELKTGHGWSTLYAFYIRTLGIILDINKASMIPTV